MAKEAEMNENGFKYKTAFILGYTGESGKALVKELNSRKIFKRVVLIGRREAELDDSLDQEFEQKVVDFNNLQLSEDVFKDVDVGFCCLGTTKAKSGSNGFVRVDHDYVLQSAQLARNQGCKHFTFLSSMNADKNSSLLYLRTKGQVEDALQAMHFDRLSIFRPAVLMCNRREPRYGEALARFFLKPVAYLFPTAITVPVEVLAKALVTNAVGQGQPVELYTNKAIHQLSGARDMEKLCDHLDQPWHVSTK